MTPARQPWLHRNKLLALIAGILIPLLLAAVGVELVREFNSSRALRAEVNKSYETRLQIQRVFSSLQDAETGVRGYVLTRDDDYLEPYLAAVTSLKQQEERLETLMADERGQGADLTRLRALTRQKMDILSRAIVVRRGGTPYEVLVGRDGGEGKRTMDEVRVVIARMIDREAVALDQRSAAADARTIRTEWMVGALFVALLAVITATALITWRYVRSRRIMLTDLKATTARQQVIFDSAIDSIITLNPSGSIETVNAAGERMFGYSAAELTRRDISVLIDIAPDGEGEFLKRLGASQGSLTTGLIRQMEGTRSSGETFPVDVALGAMELPTGTHVVAVVRDISERRRIEQLKGEFVSTVSHELRTPLTSIAGSLGLLSGGAAGPLPEKAARLIQIAQSNSQRLVRLINDILDIEKIESGKLRLELAPLDLREIAERSIEGVQGYARELGVVITLGVSDSAPVRGDADRLIQVVTNLLSNASKFSPAGGVVKVTVDRETRLARLSVVDQGSGIPESFRSRIFSKFAQADGSDTRAKGGTGLGLAIAREIAERHGGRLWFESAEGEGATFHLDLPLADVPMASADDDGPRLLIVEDDPDAADILREMLERDGFAADIAGSTRDALIAIQMRTYDACLVDLHLPDADGISLIREIRANPLTRSMPVVVVSGDAALGKARGRLLEVLDWLDKPVDQSRLRSAVSAIHRRHGEGRPLVLHVDDDRDILEVTAAALSDAAEIVQAETLAAARVLLAKARPDLVILDLGLPDGSGLELLSELGDEAGRTVPVIVYSAQEMDAALADRVEAVLTKSRTSLAGLARTVRRLTNARKIDETSGKDS